MEIEGVSKRTKGRSGRCASKRGLKGGEKSSEGARGGVDVVFEKVEENGDIENGKKWLGLGQGWLLQGRAG